VVGVNAKVALAAGHNDVVELRIDLLALRIQTSRCTFSIFLQLPGLRLGRFEIAAVEEASGQLSQSPSMMALNPAMVS
jgi:hypothetical protein